MMPATAPDVEVYAGDTTSFHSYAFFEGDDPSDLVAAGWTGWVAQWRAHSSSTEEIALSVDLGQAAGGIVSVSCTAAQATQMSTGGVWDLQASRPGETRTFVRGVTVWTRDVSRA